MKAIKRTFYTLMILWYTHVRPNATRKVLVFGKVVEQPKVNYWRNELVDLMITP